MSFEPSKYQKEIYNFIENDTEHLIVQACAGSGKTFTLIKCVKLIPKINSVVVLAFNKSIQMEIRKKLPKDIRVSTLHSLGRQLFHANNIPEVIFEEKKLGIIIVNRFKQYIKEINKENKKQNPKLGDKLSTYLSYSDTKYLEYLLKTVIPKTKSSLCDITEEGISNVPNIDGHEITPAIVEMIQDVLDDCLNNLDIIDYDDMQWIPVKKGFKPQKTYDFVFVDEAQDLSRVQFELIKIICGEHTRIIVFGDSNQAVYGFRNADSNSMRNFKEFFNAKELPLSICYRCGKNIVKYAQRIVPEIEPWDKQEPGIVATRTHDEMIKNITNGEFCICRTNAPLVNIVFTLLRAGKKAMFKGIKLKKSLLNIVEYSKAETLTDLRKYIMDKLKSYREEMIFLLKEAEKTYKERRMVEKRIDEHETLLYFTESVQSVPELKRSMEELFTNKDSDDYITCSTVHGVKGLESDVVYIYDYFLMPHPMATSYREVQEERNIEYVAITRAKKALYLIGGEKRECDTSKDMFLRNGKDRI